MAEEVSEAKLLEAHKHFTNRNYSEVLKVLSSCPQEDVKVKNNAAMVGYLANGGDIKDVIAALEAVPETYIPSIPESSPASPAGAAASSTSGSNKKATPASSFFCTEVAIGEFYYDGQEASYYNSAIALLHNGFVERAATILRELAARSPAVAPEIQIRCALMLQVATASLHKKKVRTRADDDLIAKVFAENIKLIQANASLKRMFQLAFCDNSNLHDWFRDSEKGASDRVTYYNNLGALAMNDGKESLAAIYFNNALKAFGDVDAAAQSNDLTLHSVLYNAGVCALLRKEYGAAVKALLLTQQSMKGSPLLWLRVAQSAIGVHQHYSNAAIATAYADEQNKMAAEMAKRGRLLPAFQLLQLPSTLGLYGSNTDPASRTALDTAMKAIDNGLAILVPAGTHVATAADQLVLSGNTSLFRVLQFLLCYAAYAELQRMNYAVVAAICADLLSLGKGGHPLQPDVLVTAVSYAAEALCHLGKPTAALKVLQSVSAGDFIVSDGIEDQKVRVASVMINLTLVHIANGNWKTASTLANNLISKYNATPAAGGSTATPTSASPFAALSSNFQNQTPSVGLVANQPGGSPWLHVGRCATVLQVFIELAQGNRDRALEILSLQPVGLPTA